MSGKNQIESNLRASDGTQLFVRDWPVSHPSAGSIVLLHGLGEHCGRYDQIAQFFNALGFYVRTYDQRGHGRSEGSRGCIPDEAALLQDARMVIQDFSQKLNSIPVLFGHSMGGLLAARLGLEDVIPLRCIILSSPALSIPLSGFQSILLKVSSSLLPFLGFPNGVKPRFLSHDQLIVNAYREDPLVHDKISPRLLNSLLSSIQFVANHASQLKIPCLLLVAQDDHLVDPEGSRKFSAMASKTFCHTIFYPDFYHEIFNELDSVKVFDDVRCWLEQQAIS